MSNFKGWDMAALAKVAPEKLKEIFSKRRLIEMPEKKEIKIMVKPMSANVAFNGRKFCSRAYIAYEKEVLWSLPEIVLPEPPYCVSYEFGVSSRGFDCGNAEKQTTDILSKKYNFNDNKIYEIHIKKIIVPKGKEYIQFKIESLT